MQNIFEHGGEDQYNLIKPYLDKAKLYSPEQHGDFYSFYFTLLESVLAIRAEREQIEDWVFDPEDYKKKSEVLIAVSLVDSIENLRKIAEQYERGNQFFLGDFFEKLVKFGEKRGWDIGSLQMQFTRTVGLPLINPFMEIISRKIYMSIDYN